MAYLILLLIAGTGYYTNSYGNQSRILLRYGLFLLSGLLLFTVVTGALKPGKLGDTHRWGGHLAVMVAITLPAFALGSAFENWRRVGSSASSVLVLTLVILFVTVSLASFTGYLGPSYRQPDVAVAVAAETANRFRLLHIYAIPTMFISLLAVNYWLIERKK